MDTKKYKLIIAPIVAVVIMAVQLIFDVRIDGGLESDIVYALANIVVVIVAVKGVIEDHFDGRDAMLKKTRREKEELEGIMTKNDCAVVIPTS